MSLSVLLVDARPITRSLFIRTLRLTALPVTAVHQAGNAVEALDVLNSVDVDLAVIDVEDAEGDGVALINRLGVDPQWSHVGVVALCARGPVGDEPVTMMRGAAVLQKPFTADQLRSTLLRGIGVTN